MLSSSDIKTHLGSARTPTPDTHRQLLAFSFSIPLCLESHDYL